MSDELPEGWAAATLGTLGRYVNGRAFKPGEWERNGLPIIRIQNLNDPSAPFNYSSKTYNERIRVRHGDLLIAWSASLGAFVWRGGEAWLNQHIFRVEHDARVCTRDFLLYAVRHAIDDLYDKAHGTGMVHVTKPVFESHQISLPPLPEQHRIVAKLEELLGKVDVCQKRLARVPVLLKRFRRSVLAAACSGRLTEDWREENPAETAENHSSPDDLPDVPGTWSWKRLSDIAHVRGGVTKGRKLIGERRVFLPYLRVANVQDGRLDLSEIKRIEAVPEDLPRYRLERGDVLFTEGGDRDKLGRGTVWLGEIPDCIHQNHVFRARLTTDQATPEYVSLASKSSYSRRYFFDNASQTVNLASINLTFLSALPLAIPPLAEQREIVRRAEALMALVDRDEARLCAARKQVEQVAPSLLATAFRGDLVPAEAELARREGRSFEPASVLLERVRAERESDLHRHTPRPTAARTRQATTRVRRAGGRA